ncbi:MAG: hypothetical protein IT516_07455 [Burkholderiales bacterium]|nr:hypothetical protein [Burkholderiales bacterium]
MSAGSLPPDGGASFVAGWSSAEVAVVVLGIFLVCYAIAALTSATWLAEVAFLGLVAGGLIVTWPVMILLSGAALVGAAIIGLAHKMLAPARAARIDAEADAMTKAAMHRLRRADWMARDE